MLAPIKGLPLQQLVAVSQGQLAQSVVDDLVLQVNGGIAPVEVATGIPMPPNMSQIGSARLAPFQQQIPTVATAEQLTASITFLLSDDGININGAILPSTEDGRFSNRTSKAPYESAE